MNTRRIKFIKPYLDFAVGDVMDFHPDVAQRFVGTGWAVDYKGDPDTKAESKALDAPPRDKAVKRQDVSRKVVNADGK